MVPRAHRYRRGDRLDGTPYEVLSPLVESGCGAAYEALDVELGAIRIVKTFPARAGDEAVGLLREAAADVARVHARCADRVPPVLVVGQTSDEQRVPFVVMEKLEGATLRDVLKERHHLPPREACRVAIGVLEALAEAHDAGVMHFAVKPENVFLESSERGPSRVKLVDFGAASASDDERANVRGLARCSAPEQLRRGGLRTTAQTDIYAAALVLYECLAGRGPFDDRARCNYLVEAQLYAEPPPFRSVAPDAPAALEQLVLSALAKQPGARPMSARTFVAQLLELELPARARRPSFGPTAPPGTDFQALLARERPRAPRDEPVVDSRSATTVRPAPLGPRRALAWMARPRWQVACDLGLATLCALAWIAR